MTTIYGMIDSGNCYKPRLLMAKLGRPFRHVEVSSHDGSTRSEAFTAKNPNAMVPLLEFDDGRLLAESNAILLVSGRGDALRARGCLRAGTGLSVAVLRAVQPRALYRRAPRPADLSEPQEGRDARAASATLERGNKALRVMEKRLGETPFFAGRALSVADIALYAYTHVAGEGGFDLADYPAVDAWLKRVESDPGHVPIELAALSNPEVVREPIFLECVD